MIYVTKIKFNWINDQPVNIVEWYILFYSSELGKKQEIEKKNCLFGQNWMGSKFWTIEYGTTDILEFRNFE